MKRIVEDIDNLKGIPKGYSDKVIKRAKERLGVTEFDNYMELGSKIMGISKEVISLCRGKERELEKLAEKVIMVNYDDIIERYNISLDINIGNSNEIFDNLTESMSNKINKRRIANLLTHGEGINAKRLLHSEESKEGLKKILGDKWKNVYDLLVEEMNLADKINLIMNSEDQGLSIMVSNSKAVAAGSVKAKFITKEKPYIDPDDNYDESEYNSMFENKEDSNDDEFKLPKKLIIYGLDYGMLLHESVKGIMEVLTTASIPEDEDEARNVLGSTGRYLEPIEWKYGPEIAADLRDFINENPNADKYKNVRLEVCRAMLTPEIMDDEEFFEFMEGVLSNSNSARNKMDKLIELVIKQIEIIIKYKEDLLEYERKKLKREMLRQKNEEEMRNYERQLKEYEEEQKKKKDIISNVVGIKPKEKEEENITKEIDYSKYSKSQLQKMIDDAIDDGDFDLAKQLSKYI